MRWQYISISIIIIMLLIVSCAPQAAPEAAKETPVESAPAETPSEPAQPPAEEEASAETPAEETTEDTTTEKKMQAPKTGEYMVTKDEGVIRGAGCNVEEQTVFFELHNPTDTDWTFYRKVSPTPPNQIKTVFNGMTLLDLDCDAELLAAGETVKCSKTHSNADGKMINFRQPQTEFKDDFSIVGPLIRDELTWRCIPRGEWTPETASDLPQVINNATLS